MTPIEFRDGQGNNVTNCSRFPDMPLLELQNNVVYEFFTVTVMAAAPPVVLSYWPLNTRELATRLTTPLKLTTPPVKL